MSQTYVLKDSEKNIKFHIPFTPYYLYYDGMVWRIVEKELKEKV